MLDLNRATQEQLDAITGLKGHSHEIVRYREERGGFTSPSELEELPGLSGKVRCGNAGAPPRLTSGRYSSPLSSIARTI
jgi:competence protein ComEA